MIQDGKILLNKLRETARWLAWNKLMEINKHRMFRNLVRQKKRRVVLEWTGMISGSTTCVQES
jgi:hypothetical protein